MAVRHPPAIYVVSPGGRHATGGICRMVDNFMTEWEQRERRPPLVLVDSYGNKGKGYMPAYFVVGILVRSFQWTVRPDRVVAPSYGGMRERPAEGNAGVAGTPAEGSCRRACPRCRVCRLLCRIASRSTASRFRNIAMRDSLHRAWYNLSRIFHQCGGARRKTRGNRVQRCPRPGCSAAGCLARQPASCCSRAR